MIKSTNNGTNWSNLAIGNYGNFKKIYFINENTGFIIRNDNTKYFAQITEVLIWDSVYTASFVLNDMCFKDDNTGLYLAIIFSRSIRLLITVITGLRFMEVL